MQTFDVEYNEIEIAFRKVEGSALVSVMVSYLNDGKKLFGIESRPLNPGAGDSFHHSGLRGTVKMEVDVAPADGLSRGGLVEQSANAAEVMNGSLAAARIEIAWSRLRLDITAELVQHGANCSDASVQRIIDGLPPDVLARELVRRT